VSTSDPRLTPAGPESTASDGGSTTTAPSATTTANSGGNISKKVNVGAIVGGAVGGLAFVALLGILLFFRRRHLNRVIQPPLINTGHQYPGPAALVESNPTTGSPMRLYVRSTYFFFFIVQLAFRGKAYRS